MSQIKCKRCGRWAEKQSHLCLYCRQVQPARTQALLDQILANLRDHDPLDDEKSDPDPNEAQGES